MNQTRHPTIIIFRTAAQEAVAYINPSYTKTREFMTCIADKSGHREFNALFVSRSFVKQFSSQEEKNKKNPEKAIPHKRPKHKSLLKILLTHL
mmetsp:Transcript_21097/g.25671  ORF Transcript_21097/g.25671 Transcript_21097/m.25671 type:complete len:93 (+) Transcript_21097:158-436(+)